MEARDQASNDSFAGDAGTYDDNSQEGVASVVEGSIASENTTSQDCEYEDGSEEEEGETDENGSDDDGEEVEEEVYEEVQEGEEGEIVEVEEWVTDEEGDEDGSLENSQAATADASDSDSGETEGCPICLNRFRDQDIGTPESCDHNFCLECIQEWSKNVNTCPVDRQVFRLIFAKHSVEDVIFKKIPVEDKSFGDDEEEEDDVTYCEICGQGNREDRLLLCDGCDLGFHCECLTPPLDHVPIEEWFCSECASVNREELAEVVNDDDEVRYIIAENAANLPPLRPRRRMIARTMVAERVRARIEETRTQRARIIRQILETSESEDNVAPAQSSSRSKAATSTKSKSTSKKKTTKKKRKVVKKKVVRKKVVRKKKKPRRKKRKGGKRKKKTSSTAAAKSGDYLSKQLAAAKTFQAVSSALARQKHDDLQQKQSGGTVKSRLAEKLRLSKPPVGRTIPVQKPDKTADGRRGDGGLVAFSIMGHRDSLLHIEPEQPETSTSASKAPTRTGKYSKSSLKFHSPVGKPCSATTKKPPSIEIKKTPAQSSGATFDLLGSIMQKQNILNMESEQVTINRDGSLSAKPSDTPGGRSITPPDMLRSIPVTERMMPFDSPKQIRSISPTEKTSSSERKKSTDNSFSSNPGESIFDTNTGYNRDKAKKSSEGYETDNRTDRSSKVNNDTDIDLFAAFSETLNPKHDPHSMLGQYRRNVKNSLQNKSGDDIQEASVEDKPSPDLDNDEGEIIDSCSGGEYSLVSEEENEILNQEAYEIEVAPRKKRRHNDSERRHSRKKEKEKRKSKISRRHSSVDSDDSMNDNNKYYSSEYKSRLPFPDLTKSSKRKSDSIKEDLVISIDNSLISSRRSVLEKNMSYSKSSTSWDKKESSHRRSHKDSERDRRYVEKERRENTDDYRTELSRHETRSRRVKEKHIERDRRAKHRSRSKSHEKYTHSRDRYRHSKSPDRSKRRRHKSRSRSRERVSNRDRSHRRRKDRSRERASEKYHKRSRSRSRSPRRYRDSEYRRRNERSKSDRYRRDSHKRFSDVELDADSKKPRFLPSEIGEYRFERDDSSSTTSSSSDDVTEVIIDPVEEEIQVVEIPDSSPEREDDDDDVQLIEYSDEASVPEHKETLDERIESLKANIETEMEKGKEREREREKSPEIHKIESVSSVVDSNMDKSQENSMDDDQEQADKKYDPAHPTEEETQLSLSPIGSQLVHSFQLEKDPSTLPETFQLEKDPETLPPEMFPSEHPNEDSPDERTHGAESIMLPSGPNVPIPANVEIIPTVQHTVPPVLQPEMTVQQRPVLVNPMLINRPSFGRFPGIRAPVPQVGWQPRMMIPNRFGPAGPQEITNGRFEPVSDSVPPPPPPPFGQLVRPIHKEVFPSHADVRLTIPPPIESRPPLHQPVVRPVIPAPDIRDRAPQPFRFRMHLPPAQNLRLLSNVSHSVNLAHPPPVPLNSAPPISIPINSAPPPSVPLNSEPPISVPLHSAPPVSLPLNSRPPPSVLLNSEPPISVPLNSEPPISVPLNSAPHVSVPLNTVVASLAIPVNSAPHMSVPLNSAPPISVPINATPLPISVPLNPAPLMSVPLNSAPPISVPLHSEPPIPIPIQTVSPQPVPLNTPPPISVSLNSVAPHSLPLISAPHHPVSLNSTPPISLPQNSIPLSVPLMSAPPPSVPMNSISHTVPLISEPPPSVPLNSSPPVPVPLISEASHLAPQKTSSPPLSVPLRSASPVTCHSSVVPQTLSAPRNKSPLTPPVTNSKKQSPRPASPVVVHTQKTESPSLPSSIKKLTSDLSKSLNSTSKSSVSQKSTFGVTPISFTLSVSKPSTTESPKTTATASHKSSTVTSITTSVNHPKKPTSPKLFKQTFESVSVPSKKIEKLESKPASDAKVPPINQLEVLGELLKTQVKLATIVNKKKSSSKTAKGITPKSDDKVFKVPLPPRTNSQTNSSKSNSNHKSVHDSSELLEVVDMDMSPIDDDTSIEVSNSPDIDDIVRNYKHPSKTSRKSPDFDEIVKNFKQSSKTSKISPNFDDIVKSCKQPSSKTSKKSPDFDDIVKQTSKSSKKPKLRDGDFKKVINKISKEEEDPSSAVDLTNKEKISRHYKIQFPSLYLKKLHLQERVVEEVKEAIKPYYSSKKVTKEEYKDILRKAVPKICHSKSGNVNPQKIRALVGAYVQKLQTSRIRLDSKRRDKNKSKNSDIFKGKVNR